MVKQVKWYPHGIYNPSGKSLYLQVKNEVEEYPMTVFDDMPKKDRDSALRVEAKERMELS